jgi:hypothetical protein
MEPKNVLSYKTPSSKKSKSTAYIPRPWWQSVLLGVCIAMGLIVLAVIVFVSAAVLMSRMGFRL